MIHRNPTQLTMTVCNHWLSGSSNVVKPDSPPPGK